MVRNARIGGPFVSNVANQIVVESSDVTFDDWPENNCGFATVVTIVDPANCLIGYPPHLLQTKAQAAWVALPLLNGWVNFGAPYDNAQYRIDTAGTVHLRGMIKSGTVAAGTSIAQLPVGFRPVTRTASTPTISNGALCSFTVDVSGAVILDVAANAAFLSLAPMSFQIV